MASTQPTRSSTGKTGVAFIEENGSAVQAMGTLPTACLDFASSLPTMNSNEQGMCARTGRMRSCVDSLLCRDSFSNRSKCKSCNHTAVLCLVQSGLSFHFFKFRQRTSTFFLRRLTNQSERCERCITMVRDGMRQWEPDIDEIA